MTEIAAIVLAAGRASRFGAGADDSKVIADLEGMPMVRHVVMTALVSSARPIHVVTGHAAGPVASALAGLAVTLVHNEAFASGIASSLKAGLASLPTSCAGALILLADMPRVRPGTLDALIAAFGEERAPCDAVVPSLGGRRGNPVLIGSARFADVTGLTGDEGARGLLMRPGSRVTSCAVDDPGIFFDIDTREVLRTL